MSTSQITNQTDKDKSLWVLGDLYTFKVVGEETNGNYAVVEILAQPNNGPPPHIHHRENEGFYVLDGSFRSYMSTVHSQRPQGRLFTFQKALFIHSITWEQCQPEFF